MINSEKVVLYGLVGSGLVWSGLVWSGLVWSGKVLLDWEVRGNLEISVYKQRPPDQKNYPNIEPS